jgi:hypothetical protein
MFSIVYNWPQPIVLLEVTDSGYFGSAVFTKRYWLALAAKQSSCAYIRQKHKNSVTKFTSQFTTGG